MKKLLLLAALLSVSVFFGQNDRDALKLCSVLQSKSFASNSAAEDALERILGTIGASKRFVLQPCNSINNAIATSYKGIRYILYDPDFMNALNYGNNWGNLFILAHEVGHHINGHSLDLVLYAADAVETISLAQSRQQELEADEFAGFVLARLGGPISSANEVISKISDNSDDSYSTHPSRSKRITAVQNGYYKTKMSTESKIGSFSLDELPLSEIEVIARFPNHVGGYHDKFGNMLFNGGDFDINHPDSGKVDTYQILNFSGEYFKSRCYYEYWKVDENGNILYLDGVNILDGPNALIASWGRTSGAKYH